MSIISKVRYVLRKIWSKRKQIISGQFIPYKIDKIYNNSYIINNE